MPKQGNHVVCNTHPTAAMQAQTGFYALTVVQKTGEQVQFNPAAGIPVKAYVCRHCGYVELYSANTNPEWNQ